MAKRNRITSEMSKTIAESSPLIKSTPKIMLHSEEDEIIDVDITKLEKNPYQPRIEINANSLNELVTSIEQNGLLQPIVVTKKGDKYTIIAGHRRVEAYKILGKKVIKASVLKNIQDKELAVLSLTENMVRENLHPIENALSIKYILEQGIVESQNKLAEYLGLSKGHISKMLAMLKLPISLIRKVKETNYRDINILILLNKVPEENIFEVFDVIKDLNRSSAEKYIFENYLNKSHLEKNIMIIKMNKSKINVEINIKTLDKKHIEIIQSKLNQISYDLEKNNEF